MIYTVYFDSGTGMDWWWNKYTSKREADRAVRGLMADKSVYSATVVVTRERKDAR